MVFGLGKKKKDTMGMPPGMGSPMNQQMPPLEPVQDSGLPTEQVMNFRQQGLTDNQIITALQRDGYTSDQIYSSFNQVDMQPAGPLDQGAQQGMGMPPMGAQPMDTLQGAPMPQVPPPAARPTPNIGLGESQEERIEEVAERIIDEKWEEVTKENARIVEWKDATGTTITRMQQEIEDLRKTVDNLHKAIIGKIEEYDQNLSNVGVEIKAMEKVFQKILPTFTENVNTLSRIAKNAKKK